MGASAFHTVCVIPRDHAVWVDHPLLTEVTSEREAIAVRSDTRMLRSLVRQLMPSDQH